ncbi:NADH dehydrogenase [ubiquinone] 1 beta subcomplex subunit 10-like [Saccoglossus kowalevskii]|uniref:NADH dehydrogenase [ubiquinone] 1 beta subcomplex subunit 10 n=1 Tax=Saccoglossus kowalevskii TaxID=10224 RepID=A0ABM0GKH3_SACKO|nr:PREDICTED: NADH dehydrogenase [ubiquinone] 1 beta subcomplex subunit 10-like [Saccoglossus kowalevskii]
MAPLIDAIVKGFYYTVDVPVTWFREKIEGQQNKNVYPYYHQQYRRVPDIDQCDVNDISCMYEAEMQFKRDKRVDEEITKILRKRMEDCWVIEGESAIQNCKSVVDQYDREATNYNTKYGNLGGFGSARRCLMKQKYRMIEERNLAKQEATVQ